MQQTDTVSCEIGQGRARLTLDHPGRLNALTLNMLRALDAHLARIEADAAVRSVIVDAAGDRLFCAGADVRAWGALTPQAMGRLWIREGNRVFQRLAELDAVVICVLSGDVYGGGLELALAADIRLAAEGIKIGFPEVGLGAIPAWLGCARLQELVGTGRARQMILTGEPVDAKTALAWGLVNEVLERGGLSARAQEIAGLVARRSSIAVGAAKRVLNAGLDAPRFGGLHELAGTACLASPDAPEGLAAFREKRAPEFPDAKL
jgi:enoyl-CoA hydratase/carnithine racemase